MVRPFFLLGMHLLMRFKDHTDMLTTLGGLQRQVNQLIHQLGIMEDRMDQAHILVESWLMKNAWAKGEVNVLAHRLAEREREVVDLQGRVAQLEILLATWAPHPSTLPLASPPSLPQ